MLRKNSPVGPDYSRGGVAGAISADFSVGKYRWWFIKWECSSVGRVPLMAIHYSLLLLRVIIFPFPQPASTRPTAWSARIPHFMHTRTFYTAHYPGKHYNAVRLWILYTPRRAWSTSSSCNPCQRSLPHPSSSFRATLAQLFYVLNRRAHSDYLFEIMGPSRRWDIC